MAAIKRLQPKKPPQPAPLQSPRDMWTPGWDGQNARMERQRALDEGQRIVRKGNSGLKRRSS